MKCFSLVYLFVLYIFLKLWSITLLSDSRKRIVPLVLCELKLVRFLWLLAWTTTSMQGEKAIASLHKQPDIG